MGETLAAARPGVVPGRYWHALDDGRIQCDVCPRACKLRDVPRAVRRRLRRAARHLGRQAPPGAPGRLCGRLILAFG